MREKRVAWVLGNHVGKHRKLGWEVAVLVRCLLCKRKDLSSVLRTHAEKRERETRVIVNTYLSTGESWGSLTRQPCLLSELQTYLKRGQGKVGTSQMAQQIKTVVIKPDSQNSIPRTYLVAGEKGPPKVVT